MYTPTFEDLVGDSNAFFRGHFGKAPMLRRGTFASNAKDILSLEDLDDLLHFEVIRPPYLRVTRNGDGVTEKAFTRTVTVQGRDVTESVIPDRVYELFRTGASVTWSSMNHFHSGSRYFARMLAEKFLTQSDVVVFLTPAGTRGSSHHRDPVDVFVIQLEGTKRWQLWDRRPDSLSDPALCDPIDLGAPAIDTVLAPGDVLYIPYNTPHLAEAQETLSLHFSATVRPRTWRDLLLAMIDRLLQSDEFLAFPYLSAENQLDNESEFGKLVVSLAEQLNSADYSSELIRLATEGLNGIGNSRSSIFRQTADIDSLRSATIVRRTSLPVSIGEAKDGKIHATVNGHTVALPVPVADTLKSMATHCDAVVASMFAGLSPEASVGAARSLARLGVLAIDVR